MIQDDGLERFLEESGERCGVPNNSRMMAAEIAGGEWREVRLEGG